MTIISDAVLLLRINPEILKINDIDYSKLLEAVENYLEYDSHNYIQLTKKWEWKLKEIIGDRSKAVALIGEHVGVETDPFKKIGELLMNIDKEDGMEKESV